MEISNSRKLLPPLDETTDGSPKRLESFFSKLEPQ